jgi:hypothetical protein
MLANARAVLAKADQVRATVDGQDWVQNPFPYQAKCLRWLREEFETLAAGDREFTLRILQDSGCEALVGQSRS